MTMTDSNKRATASCDEVVRACERILGQCEALACALDDGAYTAESKLLQGGTIGKHLRHTLDHVAAAVSAAGATQPIDYDHRQRGGRVECNRAEAAQAIADVCDQLRSLDAGELSQPVRVRCMLSGAGEQAELGSTLGRELAFAMHHAIHHQAMMRAIAIELGAEVPEDFGVAPDTLRHRGEACG